MTKKNQNEDMQATLASEKANRKGEIQASYKKAVEANGKALEKLSKN